MAGTGSVWRQTRTHNWKGLMAEPTPLSHSAQAVLTAAIGAIDEYFSFAESPDAEAIAAAALRAAAVYCKRDRLQLLAIADELEG